jgi:hypothetical protein
LVKVAAFFFKIASRFDECRKPFRNFRWSARAGRNGSSAPPVRPAEQGKEGSLRTEEACPHVKTYHVPHIHIHSTPYHSISLLCTSQKFQRSSLCTPQTSPYILQYPLLLLREDQTMSCFRDPPAVLLAHQDLHTTKLKRAACYYIAIKLVTIRTH